MGSPRVASWALGSLGVLPRQGWEPVEGYWILILGAEQEAVGALGR